MLVRALPFMSRPHAGLELRVWALMAVPMGVLASGVSGVLVNTVFSGSARAWALSAAVALATGSGPLANMSSVVWSHWSRGKDKIRAATALQAGLALSLLLAAAAPLNTAGLALLIGAVLLAQVLWCGIITIRASIWRANYGREARTTFAARSQIFVSLIMAAVGAGAGAILDFDAALFRGLYAAIGLTAFASLLALRRVRVRRQRQLLAAETQHPDDAGFRPAAFVAILRHDALYRTYLTWMMVLGSGNLMLIAPLILVLDDRFGMPKFSQVLLTASLPMALVPAAIPFWARTLARRHVIGLRAVNSRLYAAASLCVVIGAVQGFVPLLWLGSALLGIGAGGGTLGWNLGHNDFAPPERVAEYLGLHVTLTGIRGLIAPLVGVALYNALEHRHPGAGVWSLALPAALTTTGSLGFNLLSRRSGAAPDETPVSSSVAAAPKGNQRAATKSPP
jgi:hypothetical protein